MHRQVNEGGTYFFFSQLSFFATDELLKKAFKKHLFVGQKVLSNDYELLQQSSLVNVPQLDEGQPMPGCGGDRGSLHVSTLSGLIEMEAGDRLSLHAIPINWLCRQNDISFFGVYRINYGWALSEYLFSTLVDDRSNRELNFFIIKLRFYVFTIYNSLTLNCYDLK